MTRIRSHVRKRRVWYVAIAAGLIFLCTGAATACSGGNSSGNAAESSQQSADTTTLVTAIPLPDFPTSQIRLDLIQIEADQALGVKSTVFAFQQGNPNPIWSCAAEGLPLPITDQLSNPWQGSNYTDGNGNYNTVPIGQMDPNGIYQGDGSGTDVLCLTSAGKPYVHYWEGYVDAVTANAYWDTTKHQVVTLGTPVVPDCVVKHKSVWNSQNQSNQNVAYESCSVPKGDAVTR